MNWKIQENDGLRSDLNKEGVFKKGGGSICSECNGIDNLTMVASHLLPWVVLEPQIRVL